MDFLVDDFRPFGVQVKSLSWVLSVLLVFAIPPALILTLVAAVTIRLVATLRYLLPGAKSLSTNWWRTLFATDALTMPEIMPGYANYKSDFHFISFVGLMGGAFGSLMNSNERLERKAFRAVALFAMSAVYLILFGPAYLYRLGIKSTAWVHWPLAYISRPLRYANDPEEVRMRLWTDPREWLRRLTMTITLLGALIASVPTFATVKSTFPAGTLSIIEYAVLIDVKSLFGHPWRAVALVSAVITLVLTWYGLELSLLVKRSKAKPDRLVSAGKWAAALEYAMRLRDICGWIFWGLVFVHAGLWLVPSTSWLKGYPQEVLQFIYGDFLPPALV